MVPRLVEQTGGFARLRRDQSWVRAGYVEEIYALTNGAGVVARTEVAPD
jgi:hypothetical protein